MYQQIQPVNLFNGDRFKIHSQPHLTFTALEEPSVVRTANGDKVKVRSRMSGKNSIRTLSLPYDELVSVWKVDR